MSLVTAAGEQPIGWGLAGSLTICEDGSHVALLGGFKTGAMQLLRDGRAVRSLAIDELNAVQRTWGAAGVRHWLETELRPHCRALRAGTPSGAEHILRGSFGPRPPR